MMVGRDVLFRVAKERAEPGRAAARGARASRSRTTAGCPPCAGVDLEVRAGEIVGIAGVDDNGQAELVETIAGPAPPAGRHDPRRRRGRHRRRRPRQARRRHRPHRRGSPPPRPRARLLARREPRPARLPARADRQARADLAEAHERAARRRCSRSTTCAEAAAEALALSLSGGNQQKVVIAREIAEEPKVLIAAQPTRGLDVGAIEFVHRRLIEQRDAGRGGAARLARARGDPLAVGPRARHVRRPHRRGAGARGVRGGVRRGDARRQAGVRVSEGEGAGTHTVASQLSGYLRAGGIITPLLTALIAFFIGGLVVALTGANPFTTYKAIFDGSGLNWLLPVDLLRGPHARGAEPAADAHPHDAADPHGPGGRLRVPRRPLQHRRPGPVLRRALHRRRGGELARTDCPAGCTSSSRSCSGRSRARSGAASRASSRRRPAPTR